MFYCSTCRPEVLQYRIGTCRSEPDGSYGNPSTSNIEQSVELQQRLLPSEPPEDLPKQASGCVIQVHTSRFTFQRDCSRGEVKCDGG